MTDNWNARFNVANMFVIDRTCTSVYSPVINRWNEPLNSTCDQFGAEKMRRGFDWPFKNGCDSHPIDLFVATRHSFR
jgi:hypothetical protein